ncbi:MAG: SipW-dependent-type signal peptide-containing protein [Clostridia bacterium]|nr:SipW-dependent-type signal peptide-containing protein [Clostridia bacterium]
MKKTKNALLLSMVSLLLCISMLVGSTFAWFTDEVTSAGNKIQSGTLKLDLELLNPESGTWTSVKASRAPIFNYDKWEPGYVDTKILKIENEGSLSLQWVAKFYAAQELSILADVIDVYVCPSATALDYPANRTLDGYTHVGNLRQFINSISETTYGTLEADEVAYLGIALKMQESAGNEYQGLSLGGAFDIRIFATQYTVEYDSFDNIYDILADETIKAAQSKMVPETRGVTTFNLTHEDVVVTKVFVPNDAVENPEEPVVVTVRAIDPEETVAIGENTQAYAYDIHVTNLKSSLADGQLVTVVITAPKAYANMSVYHNGVKIDAVYDEVQGTLTFQTDSFSPYVVTAEVIQVATLEDLRTHMQEDATIQLAADITIDLSKDSKSRDKIHSYGDGKYYNGVHINGNVSLDLNGHSITAKTDDCNGTGSIFFVEGGGSLNIFDSKEDEKIGFIKVLDPIYIVWAPLSGASYVDIYGGAFISDSYAGDTRYDNGVENYKGDNRSMIYAGTEGNINIYGGYYLYNNSPVDMDTGAEWVFDSTTGKWKLPAGQHVDGNRDNGAFNVKDYAQNVCITIHEGVMLINPHYYQTPDQFFYDKQYGSRAYDKYSIKLADFCQGENGKLTTKAVTESVTIDGKPYTTWYKVSVKESMVNIVESTSTSLSFKADGAVYNNVKDGLIVGYRQYDDHKIVTEWNETIGDYVLAMAGSHAYRYLDLSTQQAAILKNGFTVKIYTAITQSPAADGPHPDDPGKLKYPYYGLIDCCEGGGFGIEIHPVKKGEEYDLSKVALKLCVYVGGKYQEILTEPIEINLEQQNWIHVAATYDPKTKTSNLYLDGTKVGSVTETGDGTFAFSAKTSILAIGACSSANKTDAEGNITSIEGGQAMHGYIGGVSLCSSVMSGEQVVESYQAMTGKTIN